MSPKSGDKKNKNSSNTSHKNKKNGGGTPEEPITTTTPSSLGSSSSDLAMTDDEANAVLQAANAANASSSTTSARSTTTNNKNDFADHSSPSLSSSSASSGSHQPQNLHTPQKPTQFTQPRTADEPLTSPTSIPSSGAFATSVANLIEKANEKADDILKAVNSIKGKQDNNNNNCSGDTDKPNLPEKTPDVEFAEWIFSEINKDSFKIQSVVGCLLSKDHNEASNSFERFKQAAALLQVKFHKNKELFFEKGSNEPKEDIQEADKLELDFAVKLAVHKVLTDENFEKDRPKNTKFESVLGEIKEALHKQKEAAMLIQSLGRGYLARKQFKVVRAAEIERRKEQHKLDIFYASPLKKSQLSPQTVNESTSSRRLFSDLIPSNPTLRDFSNSFRDFLSKKVLEEKVPLSKIIGLAKTNDEFKEFIFNYTPNALKNKEDNTFKSNGQAMINTKITEVYTQFLDDMFEVLKNTNPVERQSGEKNSVLGFRAALRSYFLGEALKKGGNLFQIGNGIDVAIDKKGLEDSRLALEFKQIFETQKTKNGYFSDMSNLLALAKEVYDQFLDDKAEDYKSYLAAIATAKERNDGLLQKLDDKKADLFSGDAAKVSEVISGAAIDVNVSDDFRVVVGFMANLGAGVMKAALEQQDEQFNKKFQAKAAAHSEQVRKLEEDKALVEAQLQQLKKNNNNNSNGNSNLNNNNSNNSSQAAVVDPLQRIKTFTSFDAQKLAAAQKVGYVNLDLVDRCNKAVTALESKQLLAEDELNALLQEVSTTEQRLQIFSNYGYVGDVKKADEVVKLKEAEKAGGGNAVAKITNFF